jgi:signal peptidase I
MTESDAVPRAPKKQPYIAAILSGLLPGAGQFYLGTWRRGLAQLGLLIALLAVFIVNRTQGSFYGVFATIFASLGVCIFSSVDATRQAARKVATNWRWWVTGFVAVLLALFIYPNVTLRLSGFALYSVPSVSMEPTIRKDDKIIVDRRAFRMQSPSRGDVITFRREEGSAGTLTIVKRIVGMPGDSISGTRDSVEVNGKLLAESYANYEGTLPSEYGSWGPFKVPQRSYFVLGDHRNISLDSRMPGYGFVSEGDIIGRPIFVFQRNDDQRPGIPIK